MRSRTASASGASTPASSFDVGNEAAYWTSSTRSLPLLCQLPTRMRVNEMTQSERDTQPSVQDVALVVGGGPGISSSCARLFAKNGMRVAVAARNPEKAVLETLEKMHGVRRYACDASQPAAV